MMLEMSKNTKSPIKLFIGCGPLPIHQYHCQFIDDSWTLIDLYVNDPKIVKMDARCLDYDDNSVEKIYSSHLLEHFAKKEVVPILTEWWRVLKDGGKLRLNVPNLEWAAKCLLGKVKSDYFITTEMILDIFYGNQAHKGEFHKTGFTKELLEKYLKGVGFKNIKVWTEYEAHNMNCLLVTARKP